MVWGNTHSHHSIKSEEQEGEVHEEEIPKELHNCPFKSNHGVHYNPIHDRLDENVRELNHNLHYTNSNL